MAEKTMMGRGIFTTSPERRRMVINDITEGSEPGIRFYLMVVVSTMIASFGLITNSTAVIIGAMLVAPLMTPIFGISLALIRSDAHLLARAGQAEIAGVVAAILMGFALGWLYPGLEPTPEMLARTQPQLFDLLVAVFSGFAGAYALVDEKISPALPGVAIATAIVPPLANTGLCFSLGAYEGGIGSFLLFFSNFLSILLIGSLVFWIFKMTRRYDILNKTVLIKRFSLPIIGFFLIAVVLSNSLFMISQERKIKNSIDETLASESSKIPSLNFSGAVYDEVKGKLYVKAKMYSATTVSPHQVSRLQDALEKNLNREVELTVNSTLAQTVSALDSFGQVTSTNLDGSFIVDNPDPLVLRTKIADSTIRNFLADMPIGFLKYVRIFQREDRNTVVAWIDGTIPPRKAKIRELEQVLRSRLEDPALALIIRFQQAVMYDRDGKFRFEISGVVDPTPEQEDVVEEVQPVLQDWFENSEYILDSTTYILIKDEIHFYVEVVGRQLFPVDEVYKLESLLVEQTGEEIKLHIKSKLELVATSTGYESYESFAYQAYLEIESKLKEEMRKFIESSSL